MIGLNVGVIVGLEFSIGELYDGDELGRFE